MDYCIGCGCRIWTPLNENESGEWCSSSGDCAIVDFAGVNRMREAVLTLFRAACVHEPVATSDKTLTSCVKCHKNL